MKHAKETMTDVAKHHKTVERAKRKLADAEKAAVSNNDEEKMKLVRTIQNRMKSSVTALEAHADQQQSIMQYTFSRAGLHISQDMAVAAIRRAE